MAVRSQCVHRTSLRQLCSTIPDFLAPSVAGDISISKTSLRSFTSTTLLQARKNGNPQRGVSPLRRTGPRQKSSAHRFPLPQPVLEPSGKTKIETAEDHGFWEFFRGKQTPNTPTEDAAHGRAWTAEELRRKSWEDLHRLWWVCMKEKNRIATSRVELDRLKGGFGDHTAIERIREVKKTQKAIRHVLIERWYAWEDARKLAQNDETVDLSGDGPAYEPYKRREPDDSSEEVDVDRVAPAAATATT